MTKTARTTKLYANEDNYSYDNLPNFLFECDEKRVEAFVEALEDAEGVKRAGRTSCAGDEENTEIISVTVWYGEVGTFRKEFARIKKEIHARIK